MTRLMMVSQIHAPADVSILPVVEDYHHESQLSRAVCAGSENDMTKDLDEARKHWRTATIAEQEARWALDDATASKDAEEKETRDTKEVHNRLKEAVTSSAVSAIVGTVTGAVVGWLIGRRR